MQTPKQSYKENKESGKHDTIKKEQQKSPVIDLKKTDIWIAWQRTQTNHLKEA